MTRLQPLSSIQPRSGFTAPEILLVIAGLGLLSALAAPSMLRELRAAKLRGAADQVATLLNQGRQLAISQGESVCVGVSGHAIQYRIGGCHGRAWTGPGTDATGRLPLVEGVAVAASAQPVFSALGGATPAASFTLTHSPDGARLTVVLAASGRIRVTR